MKFEWRKMRRGVLGGCMVVTIAVGMMGTLFFGDRAMAGIGVSESTCNDITGNVTSSTKIYNPSLYKACTSWQGNKNADWGALWISNIPKTTDGKYDKDYLSSRVTTNNAIINGNSMTVYLRGAVMGKNGANARCIDITRKVNDVTYRPITFVEDGHLNDNLCLITVKGQTNKKWVKDYWTGRQANSNPFDNAISFQGTTMALDLTNISKWGGAPTRAGGHVDYRAANVDIYRCFDGSELIEPDRCWGDNSKLVIGGNVMRAKALVWLSSNHNIKSETGYVITNYGAAELVLDSCEKGCRVEFKHTLEKIGPSLGQKIYYKVGNSLNRTNHWTNFLAGKALTSMNGDEMGYAKTVTLYPGERYCSTMNFGLGTSEDDLGDMRGVGVCAYAKGTYKTTVDLSIKDGEYYLKDEVYYVKPNSSLRLNTTFNTNVQKATEIRLMAVNVEGKGKFLSDARDTTLRDVLASKGYDWANKLYLLKNNNNGSVVQEYRVGTKCGNAIGGSVQNRNTLFGGDWKCTNNKTESFANVGKYSLVAKTNANQDKNKVPSKITFVNADSSDKGAVLRSNISVGSVASSTLKVWVPYNFKNSTWVDGDGMKNIDLESGFDVKYFVRVGKRKNEALGAEYATQVDNATSGVYWCKAKKDKIDDIKLGEVCEGDVQTETYDVDENKEGFESETLLPNDDEQNPNYERSISIGLKNQEVEVGDIICVWSWMTPGDSLVDLQMSNEWKNNTAYSWDNGNSENKKVCGQIGREKSPTIQVWGGNVLSKGKLDVSAVKEKPFNNGNMSITRRFGSFGELGVFASNSGNFASGAALGYEGIHQWNEDSKNVLLPSYLGRNKDGSEEIGGGSEGSMGELKNTSGIDGAIRGIENFANALERKYCDDGASGCSDSGEVSTDICGDENCEGKSVNICDENGSCKAKTTVIIKPENSVVIRRDDVKITTNVQYEDGNYGSFSEVPRFIVIANNIEIGCGVTRIDGLLVARGTVNTCKSDTPEDREKEDHSNQLIVNGAIIANKLVANRTYGAGPGIYSIVPAEIVRFDPTLLDLDLGSNDSNPKIVNITELPPRY